MYIEFDARNSISVPEPYKRVLITYLMPENAPIPFCYCSQGHKLNLPQLLRGGRRKPPAPLVFILTPAALNTPQWRAET